MRILLFRVSGISADQKIFKQLVTISNLSGRKGV